MEVLMTTSRRIWTALLGPAIAVVLLGLYPGLVPGDSGLAWAGCKYRKAQPTKVRPWQAKRATICLINSRRASHGVPKLNRHRDLNSAARRHANYVEDHHCWSHQCAGELSLLGRVQRSGYSSGASGWGCGEVMQWGDMTPKQIVRSWMSSSLHRAALLDRKYEHLGVGVVWGSPQSAKAKAGIYVADVCWRSG
jgi:uncharacterized protein YkwD